MNSNILSNTLNSAALLMLLATGAQANELLPRAHYADQLDRCIAEIRDELNVSANEHLQHRVTEIEKDNIWYEFTIETQGSQTDAVSTCRGWRFEDRAVAEFRSEPAGVRQLADNR